MIQARGVELHEFHVRDSAAGAISHRDPVAGGDVRIGGVEVSFAATTSGEERHGSGEGFNFSGGLIQNVNSEATVIADISQLLGRDEIDGEMIFEDFDVSTVADGGQECAFDFTTCD